MKFLVILIKNTLFLAIFLLVAVFTHAQTSPDTIKKDSIFFLNGEVREVNVVDTVAHLIKFFPGKVKGRPRIQEIEKSKVFSLKFSDGQERIIYFHDSALGNVLTILEARMFMLGEQEADKNYRNKWPAIIGFAVSAVSPLVFADAVLISPIPAAVIPLHTLIPVIKVNTEKIVHKEYLQYDTYLMGYVKVARKKNFIHSIIGAGAGLAAGLGAWAILK